MTFNNIQDGDPGDPTKVMENWRHVNYGNNLLPVNSSGVSVNETLDLGSASYAWNNLFVKNLNISGVFSVASQPFLHLTGGTATYGAPGTNISGFTELKNVGSFTVSSGKITPATTGVYEITIHAEITNFDARDALLQLRFYNSSNVLQAPVPIQELEDGQSIAYINGSTKYYFNSGDYMYATIYAGSSGGTSTLAACDITVLKLF